MDLFKKFFNFSKKKNSDNWLFGQTDTGQIREINEDFIMFFPDKKLFLIADGMGGHNFGDIASKNASELIANYFNLELLSKINENEGKIKESITNSLSKTHDKVSQMSKDDPELQGMGCTLIIGLVNGDLLHLGHVGDSRAYLINETEIKLLTIDHSFVMELVQTGKMTMEESRKSSIKNELSQAIGASDTVKPEYNCYSLKRGDRILLCSDGLWDMLEDSKIHDIVKSKKPIKEICKTLIDSANEAGGKDNISVVIYNH